MCAHPTANTTATFDLLLFCDDSNCFPPDESDTQRDLGAIKSDEVVLISQTAIAADE